MICKYIFDIGILLILLMKYFISLGKKSLLSNLKVLLLEGSPDKKFELKSEYSNRVVALNQNTKSLMKSLDVWQHVERMRLQPVRYMQVCITPISIKICYFVSYLFLMLS